MSNNWKKTVSVPFACFCLTAHFCTCSVTLSVILHSSLVSHSLSQADGVTADEVKGMLGPLTNPYENFIKNVNMLNILILTSATNLSIHYPN